jgi:hypothetical protein
MHKTQKDLEREEKRSGEGRKEKAVKARLPIGSGSCNQRERERSW